ncbi:ABC transporter permease [Williamsia sp. CHRR-6]|uniref:ABC transporter permease n=1 Tax=Williamsia sp. CHRR-6 TaxID=2835871 RepID=UPI001BDAA615|nr:ABC transporter permease [Williamsia sp. CHRR-6]MBT0565613.1 ABC transporter permease [Williamsia sp. CHRR-6]
MAVVALAAPTVYWAVDLLPGDAATQSLRTSSASALDARRDALGLDRPRVDRFLEWLGGLGSGHLGRTLDTGTPVSEVIGIPIRNSVVLASCAVIPALVLGVGLGIWTGTRAGRRADRVISTAATAVLATPEFVVAVGLLLVFALWTRLLPPVSLTQPGSPPWDTPEILVLPTMTAAIMCAVIATRLTRAVVATENLRPHVEAARLAGVPERVVVFRHLMPGAVGPLAQVAAAVVPYLVAGTVVIENVYGYPGIGSLLVSRIAARDSTAVASITMILVVIVAMAYAVADMAGSRGDQVLAPR